jgi:hypothetical protein
MPPAIFHHLALVHPLLEVNATRRNLHLRHSAIHQFVRNILKTICAIRDITSSTIVYEERAFSMTHFSSRV